MIIILVKSLYYLRRETNGIRANKKSPRITLPAYRDSGVVFLWWPLRNGRIGSIKHTGRRRPRAMNPPSFYFLFTGIYGVHRNARTPRLVGRAHRRQGRRDGAKLSRGATRAATWSSSIVASRSPVRDTRIARRGPSRPGTGPYLRVYKYRHRYIYKGIHERTIMSSINICNILLFIVVLYR